MFDDQAGTNQPSVPSNLPLGEPEDMFSGTVQPPSADVPETPVEPESPEPVPEESAMSSAISAGMLRPKVAPPQAPVNVPLPPSPAAMADKLPMGDSPADYSNRPPDNVMSAPLGGKKVLYTLVILICLGILGGGGAWAYFTFINPRPSLPPTVKNPPVKEQVTPVTQPIVDQPATQPVVVTTSASTTPDERILFGEPVLDTDGDGLDDSAEKKIGTDMLKWDTDGDGLSDGDEVLTWHTNPLKADTDGDGYPDGAEIKNGYNPNGPGKLFPVTSTPVVSITSGVSSSPSTSTVKK